MLSLCCLGNMKRIKMRMLSVTNLNVVFNKILFLENCSFGLCQGASNEYPQHAFTWRNEKKKILPIASYGL